MLLFFSWPMRIPRPWERKEGEGGTWPLPNRRELPHTRQPNESVATRQSWWHGGIVFLATLSRVTRHLNAAFSQDIFTLYLTQNQDKKSKKPLDNNLLNFRHKSAKISILYIKNEFAKQFFHGSLNNFGHKGLAVIIMCNQIQNNQKTIQCKLLFAFLLRVVS
jgi:hypothetical protein